MDREQIFEVVKQNIIRILPDLPPETITIEKSLTDLGANSIDRVEVATYSMEDLDIVIPRVELRQASNIRDLVDVLYAGMHRNSNG
jgi:polyketide biosynthesis acyl carrier protein